MSYLTLQGRPIIEKQPSGLRKITRFWKVDPAGATQATVEAEAFKAFGTADDEFTTAYLIGQTLERRSEQGVVFTLARVYQELADNALTATTEVSESTTFDGRRVTRTKYICKASQAAALRPVIGSGAPAVFQVEIEKNGPVAILTTFAIEITNAGFVYSQSDEIRNNGKLLLRTIRTLAAAAATPGGFTATGTSTQVVDGYTVYSSTFAKGEGRIASDVSYKQNGKLKITTIRYLNTDDGTPLAGNLVNDDSAEQDGYTLYTKGYAEIVGDGIISNEREVKKNGKFVSYRIVRLGSAPVIPGATIGGTVVSISTETRQEDGFPLYDYRWAEGYGRISLSTEVKSGGNLTLSTVRYFNTDDGAAPDGTVIDTNTTNEDGVNLTTKVYAAGNGEISRETDKRFNGQLLRTTIRHLTSLAVNAQPTTDPHTTGSTITGEGKSDADGYRVWTVTWTKGLGTVSTTEEHEEGSLKITTTTTIIAPLGDLPAEPSNLLRRQVQEDEGYRTVVDRYISAGAGESSYTESTRADGSTEYNVTAFGNAAAVPADPTAGGAYLVGKRQQPQPGGYWTNQATYVKPPATVTLKKQMNFPMPGLATFSGTQLVLDPPINRTVLADVEISYGTTQLTDLPYAPTRYSSFYEAFKPTATGIPVSRSQGLGSYVGSANVIGTNGNYNGVECDTYSATISASNPTTRPTGLTNLEVDNEIYLVSLTGTVVYRRVKATYSF